MRSGGIETAEKPVAETTRKSGLDNFAASPTTLVTFADRHIGPNADEVTQMLRELGCDQIQGYLIGRPMPAEDVGPMLRAAALAAA
jgi:hypothetical protein